MRESRPTSARTATYRRSGSRTLASIYSVRPTPFAGVSAPVTWDEIERGIRIEDFRIDNIVARVSKLGDLWKPVLGKKRFDLYKILK